MNQISMIMPKHQRKIHPGDIVKLKVPYSDGKDFMGNDTARVYPEDFVAVRERFNKNINTMEWILKEAFSESRQQLHATENDLTLSANTEE